MNNKARKVATLFGIVIIFYLVIHCLGRPTVAHCQQTPSHENTTIQQTGPLELTAKSANLLLVKRGRITIFQPNIVLKIKNVSSSNVGLLLCKRCLAATDNQGQSLFNPSIKVSGMSYSDKNPDDFQRRYRDELTDATTLYPNQSCEVQFYCADEHCTRFDDSSNKIHDSHNPNKVVLSGMIGLRYTASEPELIPFSFSDIPLTTISR